MLFVLATLKAIDGLTIKCYFDEFPYEHTNFVDDRFKHEVETYYRCYLRNLTITSADDIIEIDKSGYYNPKNFKEMIWIEYSEMNWIPHQFFDKFPKLNYFVLLDSKLESLERSSFKSAYQLKKLRFDKVHIPRLNGMIFADMPTLEYLSIVDSDVRSIDEHAFSGLEFLKGLYLTGNRIIVFEEEVFQPLINLEELFLNQNKIKVLQEDLFKNNSRLKTLSFNQNKIFIIDPHLFDYTRDLEFVGFKDNSCLDREFEIVDGDYEYLLSALSSCSEMKHLYFLLIPFTLLIICLIAYSYYLAVIKRMKLFHK